LRSSAPGSLTSSIRSSPSGSRPSAAGIATIGIGITLILDRDILAGIALTGAGIAFTGGGIALILDHDILAGIALTGIGIAFTGIGIASVLDQDLTFGIAAIGGGIAAIGAGIWMARASAAGDGTTEADGTVRVESAAPPDPVPAASSEEGRVGRHARPD
jgi:hypothetical protein